MNEKYKKWFVGTIVGILIVLILFALPTIIIDPYMHYHAPIKGYGYVLNANFQRYYNDGIVRHFDYDAILTGTSMTENFKTSEADELFGYHFIKVPYSGGYYKEVDHLVKRAFTSDNDIKIVVRSLDYSLLIQDKDAEHPEEDPRHPQYKAPEYLVNSNPFDDVKYIFNKSVLLNVTCPTYRNIKEKKESTNFDNYSYWGRLSEN